MEEMLERSKNIRVVTICIGEAGHYTPILRIAAALERAGHEVLACMTEGYAEERFKKAIDHHGIKAPAVFVHEPKVSSLNTPNERLGDEIIESFHTEVAKLMPDLILTDHYAVYQYIVADRLKIPLVINHPAPLRNSFPIYPGITGKRMGIPCSKAE